MARSFLLRLEQNTDQMVAQHAIISLFITVVTEQNKNSIFVHRAHDLPSEATQIQKDKHCTFSLIAGHSPLALDMCFI